MHNNKIKRKLVRDLKEQFFKLVDSGMISGDIADELCLNPKNVYLWKSKYKTPEERKAFISYYSEPAYQAAVQLKQQKTEKAESIIEMNKEIKQIEQRPPSIQPQPLDDTAGRISAREMIQQLQSEIENLKRLVYDQEARLKQLGHIGKYMVQEFAKE